jgi:phosphoglycolate phosphatase
MPRLRALLFDLDGVLIDSLPSITACMNHALASLGRPPIDASMARPLIGPPLEDSAMLLLGGSDPAQLRAFIDAYRERYAATCSQETLAMPGMQEVLTELAQRWPLALATSKPEVFARQILAALGVAECFVRGGIFGRSLTLDSEGKAAVVARALTVLGGAEGLVMIGDREHDVLGAAAHGIPTIGVLHGMGSREELERAGARWIAADLRALPELLARIDAGSA